ncbi:MAG: GTPase ObgE [Ignavibacteriae bacterium]|nr:GTPase ObgE [Ignavibacteriota bacterium]
MFIDYAKIELIAGNGGNGAVAFRREKYVPKGGPSGGNGGNGGSIIIKADRNLHTLLDFRYKKKYAAQNGQQGGNSLKDGKSAENLIIKVPVGTVVKDAESDLIIADLDEDEKEFIAAKGGKGGKGNSNFATPTNQAPRFAEDGKPGESANIILELKLLADVGLVGFPNAGKSTFISAISAAKPKIADYPFTTLQPNLGIVQYKDFQSFTVADIPGIIEGAHEGKGLGHKFLRHIERTGILLIMIECSEENPIEKYKIILNELEKYSDLLAEKEKIVVLTKVDLLPSEELKKLKKIKFPGYKDKLFIISSAAGIGINDLLDELWKRLFD